MLTKVAIDPSAILMPHADPALRASLTRTVLRHLKDQGLIFLGGGASGEAELRQQVKSLAPALQTDWTKALAWLKMNGLLLAAPPGWDGSFSQCDQTTLQALDPFVHLVAMRNELAIRFGADATGYAKPFLGLNLELCRLDCLLTSPIVEIQSAQRQGFRRRGESVDQVWSLLFRDFVRQFDNHVVIDRYALPRLRRPFGTAGIECYLRRLSTEGGATKYVEVISTLDAGQTEAEVKQRLGDFIRTLPTGRFKGVDLLCVDERDFQPEVHYRLVRFNKVHCLLLDKGIEILEGLNLRANHPYRLENREGAIAQDETSLRAKAGRAVTVFRPTAVPVRAAVAGSARSITLPREPERPMPGRARI